MMTRKALEKLEAARVEKGDFYPRSFKSHECNKKKSNIQVIFLHLIYGLHLRPKLVKF